MVIDAAVWDTFEAHALKWPNDPGVESTLEYFNWWTTAIRESFLTDLSVDSRVDSMTLSPLAATE